jgi:hypothetical protein
MFDTSSKAAMMSVFMLWGTLSSRLCIIEISLSIICAGVGTGEKERVELLSR